MQQTLCNILFRFFVINLSDAAVNIYMFCYSLIAIFVKKITFEFLYVKQDVNDVSIKTEMLLS